MAAEEARKEELTLTSSLRNLVEELRSSLQEKKITEVGRR